MIPETQLALDEALRLVASLRGADAELLRDDMVLAQKLLVCKRLIDGAVTLDKMRGHVAEVEAVLAKMRPDVAAIEADLRAEGEKLLALTAAPEAGTRLQ